MPDERPPRGGAPARPVHLTQADARRIALAAQGFDRPRPTGRVDARHIRRAIRRLGLLQIDSVNVLVPAHYLVLYSRVGAYDLARLDDLVYRRREFTEQWAHEASIVPAEHWPLVRHCVAARGRRARALAAFMERHAAYAAYVHDHVRAHGPVAAAEVPEPDGAKGRAGEWWGWTLAKSTLEAHFTGGTLAIAGRRSAGFAREYDLAERVIPAEHHGRAVERDEALRELLRLAARAHGVGTVADLADYYRIPASEARPRLAELVEAGELRAARVEGWREPAYLHASAPPPRPIRAATLLSPFDPVVWYRPRTARLFGFDYRIEIYTPREKRRWGYYVLPFLLGDQLVARVDLKADRKARRLVVPAAHLEPGAEAHEVASALAAELRNVARWLALDEVVVQGRSTFGRLLAKLR